MGMPALKNADPNPNRPGQPPKSTGGVVDRRMWADRRSTSVDGVPLNPPSGLERRRGPGRRLSDFARSAEEGDLTKEQFLFLMAVEQFKKSNQVTFPTWTDVLEVVRLLGYRKTMPMEIKITSAEDWREAPDTPSDVRTDRQKQRNANAEAQFRAQREAA
ncbi:hypothetical protein PHYC_00916 [Phycisphaerales bacterium]|nr:hypothetical protein PHYC_00916 [Phycisphaerales bacterium]